MIIQATSPRAPFVLGGAATLACAVVLLGATRRRRAIDVALEPGVALPAPSV